jgi:hypothetical protein
VAFLPEAIGAACRLNKFKLRKAVEGHVVPHQRAARPIGARNPGTNRVSYENGAGGYRGTEARQPARRWPFGWDSGKSAQASPNAQSLIEECLCHD